MLILDRKESQVIYIGNDIEITILGVRTGQNDEQYVRVGINAPQHLSVDRKEVRERRLANVNKVVHNSEIST